MISRPAVPVALVLSILLAGCEDGPTKPPPTETPPPPAPTTPQNALLRMAAAFEERDSVVTDSVYDDAYQGSSTDQADPGGGTTLTFSKADEVRIVASMAGSASITFVDADLKSPNTWVRTSYASDPPDWVVLQISNWRIEVRDLARGEYAASSFDSFGGSLMEFTFKPTTPDASSPTDTTWTIIRWREVKSGP